VSGCEVGVDHVGADEPGSATHEDSHRQDCNGFTC
jgi:hypothetical protein